MNYYDKLEKCLQGVRKQTDFSPKIALVLGSGLGNYANTIKQIATVNYSDIQDFPQSTVEGHAGRFIFGYIDKTPIVAMQGRVHYYEGYPMDDVVLPIRLMRLLGADAILLTNAAGGVNFDFTPGDLMLITDHISSFVPSPLIGENIHQLGVRFPDMSNIYDKKMQEIIRNAASTLSISLQEGTYLQFSGPQYETPAEIRMARLLGADAVGMSTTCEAIAANHMGMRVAGISCITNYGSGMSDQPLNHLEVQETADHVAKSFESLVTRFLTSLGK